MRRHVSRTGTTPAIHPRACTRIALGLGVTAAVALTATGGANAAGPEEAASPGPTQRVEYFTGPDGHPRHTNVPGATPLSPQEKSTIEGDGDVTSIVKNGPVDTKVDVVFIGDGYNASQQEDFHADARAKWEKVSAVEPYASYKDLFNVWAVDAVSRDSGVSGDPTSDVVKNTALGSYFFCEDTERLLCVDTNKVESYAKKAADPDLVIVLGNSTKYGGAGYNDITSPSGYDGVATASSDNADSDQVVVHETGHSFGKLADEYWYDESSTYPGAEPGESNLSELSAAEMSAQQKKWYRWLGESSPDGGTVGAYEGGGYYAHGLNRPTDNSIMRTLGREFNLPGREAMIAGFHRHAPVLTGTTPTDRALRRDQRISVRAADGVRLRWSVDGHAVKVAARDASHPTPRILGVPADGRAHTVSVRATDPTDAVRDPALRTLLTETRTWRVAH
ncbi:M64 family metallopeptidase [Streptomyces sp. NPDC048436]|uniref:M64 family metallopeptidase n=1 Tax=Streptomyces sp. NPDC048436 TaxID=3365550 RepID=UPI0037149BE8